MRVFKTPKYSLRPDTHLDRTLLRVNLKTNLDLTLLSALQAFFRHGTLCMINNIIIMIIHYFMSGSLSYDDMYAMIFKKTRVTRIFIKKRTLP